MARRRTVLFAIPTLHRGGPDRVIFELLSQLDRTRFAPSLVVGSPEGDYLAKLPADVRVVALGDSGRFRDRYPAWRTLCTLLKASPDVVFGTQRMILTLGAIAPALPKHTRLVLRQANDVSADFASLIARSPMKYRVALFAVLSSLKRADAIVCQSFAMERDLRERLGPRAKLHVIYNPIDVDRISTLAHNGHAQLPGEPSLVSVGRLTLQKGFDLLLPALALVRARYPGVHLTIFGDGPEQASLERLRDSLGLTTAVTFAGFSSRLPPSLRAADLFVLASRYEGFPNAALEALACGTPVMLTNCPGANAEIVRERSNGFLAASTKVADIASALDTALANFHRCSSDEIQRDCSARFSSRRILSQYERVFEFPE